MESIEQTFNGAADWGRKVTCTISRNGDLISRVYLQVTLPQVTVTGAQSFRWLNWLGHVMIKNVEVEIGGQRIDKHYGDWMHIWNELTQASGKAAGYASMVGNVPRLVQPVNGAGTTNFAAGALNNPAGAQPSTNPADYAFGSADTTASMPSVTLYVPLEFWFCRNAGLALPLIALQYHEVKINLEFNQATNCYWVSNPTGFQLPSLVAASLYVDYVYLDTDERRRFAQISHEYLIEQLQFTGDESVSSTSNKIKLNFNHPVKELVWVVQPDENVDATLTQPLGGRQWFNYTDALDVSALTGTPMDPLGNGITTSEGGSTLTSASTFSVVPGIGQVLQGGGLAGGNVTGSTATQVLNATQSSGLFAGLGNTGALLDRGNNPVQSAKLQLNGHDRFSERDGRYFNLVQPYQHHTNCPAVGINVYSFGLKPEEHQPSGTCNMSRIDNATLQLTLTNRAVRTNTGAVKSCKVRVYATSYNVLRIMSGMGGLHEINGRRKVYRPETCHLFISLVLKVACYNNVSSYCRKSFVSSQPKWLRSAASVSFQLTQHILLFGKPLNALSTKVQYESLNWPRIMNLGMVKMIRIGQLAYSLPNCAMLAYGRVPETERIWVINDGVNNQRLLKIQSSPLGNLRELECLFQLNQLFYGFLYSFLNYNIENFNL
jgi:hypothetical protein